MVTALSVEKRVKEAAMARQQEWKDLWARAEKELESELKEDMDVLAIQADQEPGGGGQQSMFRQQKEILRHRQTQLQLKRCSEGLKDVETTLKVQSK